MNHNAGESNDKRNNYSNSNNSRSSRTSSSSKQQQHDSNISKMVGHLSDAQEAEQRQAVRPGIGEKLVQGIVAEKQHLAHRQ